MQGFEVLFFARIAGCLVTVVASWYSILKELTDSTPWTERARLSPSS
jgi:hypothetical protein